MTCRVLDVGAVMVTAAVLVQWSTAIPPRWSDFDFNHFYVTSRILLEGQNPYTTPLKPMSDALGFKYSEAFPVAAYPPSFLWLFTPLAGLPPRAAFAIWVGVEIVCLVIILWLTRQLLGERLSLRGWLFVAALAITSRTVTFHLLYSQVQLLLAALVLAAYTAHRAGRHGWACLAISTAGILKFYPFVLLPWFVWSSSGCMRVRLHRILWVIGFVFAIIVLTGPRLWCDFLQYGIPVGVGEEVGRNFHFSLSALVTNLGYAYHHFRPSPGAKQWWWTMGTIAGLLVIAVSYYVCLTTQRDPEAQFCLLCTAMLAGTITVQGHYFVLLVFPLAAAAVRIAAKPASWQIFCFVLLMVAFNCVDPPDSPFLLQHSFLYLFASDLPLYGLIGLGVFFWRELRVQRQLTPAFAGGQN